MTMPPEIGTEGPIDYDTLMALRNNARGQTDMGGAAGRRLSGMPQEQSQPLVGSQPPEDMILSDMQEQEEASIEPPDITQSAAQTMMRYGAVQDYLMRARGEIPPNG